VLFIAVGVGVSIFNYNRARAYEEGYARYQRRRRDLLSRQRGYHDAPPDRYFDG
jgi:hypothetical protein